MKIAQFLEAAERLRLHGERIEQLIEQVRAVAKRADLSPMERTKATRLLRLLCRDRRKSKATLGRSMSRVMK